MTGGAETAVDVGAGQSVKKKRGLAAIPKPAKIALLVIVVLAIIYFVPVRMFLLKPKPASTAPTSTSTTTTMAASTTTPAAASSSVTTPKPAAKSDDLEMATWSGPVVDANGSDTFFINKDGTRTQVELDGVEMPGYGALCSEMERQARGIVTGTVRVEPVTVEHGINQCSAKVTLAGGRDAAEALTAAGWVLPADDASEKILKLAAGAESAQRGMHRSEYDRPPWTNH